jgi:hypothetical protein
MQFPRVKVAPDQDLDTAYKQVTQAVEEAGIGVYHPSFLQGRLPSRDFSRIFLVLTDTASHIFFVCPFRWADEYVMPLITAGLALLKGYSNPIFHFLAAYPVPEDITSLFHDIPALYGIETALESLQEGKQRIIVTGESGAFVVRKQ